MINIDKGVETAVRTGKVSFGLKTALQNSKSGRGKLIILASNCPSQVRKTIEYNSKLSNMPILIYNGSSMDLAGICGKPFVVSALCIREQGDSDLFNLIKTMNKTL